PAHGSAPARRSHPGTGAGRRRRSPARPRRQPWAPRPRCRDRRRALQAPESVRCGRPAPRGSRWQPWHLLFQTTIRKSPPMERDGPRPSLRELLAGASARGRTLGRSLRWARGLLAALALAAALALTAALALAFATTA